MDWKALILLSLGIVSGFARSEYISEFACADDAAARFVIDRSGRRNVSSWSDECWNSRLREMFECWNVFDTAVVGVPLNGFSLQDALGQFEVRGSVEIGQNTNQLPLFTRIDKVYEYDQTDFRESTHAFLHSHARDSCTSTGEGFCPPQGAYSPPNVKSKTTLYVIGDQVDGNSTSLLGKVTHRRFRIGGGDPSPCSSWFGTHAASLSSGRTHGVSPTSSVVSVASGPGCMNFGTTRRLLRGLQWVLDDRRSGEHSGPSVAMILSSIDSSSEKAVVGVLEDLVSNLVSLNVTVVTPASNSPWGDSCTTSPSRMANVITVGAIHHNGSFASAAKSSQPGCVDIWAPGMFLKASFSTGFSSIAELSGNSVAASVVAGVALLVSGTDPSLTPRGVFSAMRDSSAPIPGIPDSFVVQVPWSI